MCCLTEVDVKIKRYMAASMRAALDQVRLEQGPDAVILSSRRTSEGIEVIAAIDYDEALIAGAARQYAMAAAAAPTASLRPAASPNAATEAVASPPPAAKAVTREHAAPAQVRSPAPTLRPAPKSAAAASLPPAVPGPRSMPPAAPAKAPRSAVAVHPRTPAAPAAMHRPPDRRAPSALARDLAAAAVPEDTQRGFATVQRELKDLRHLLENELAGISWHDKRVREPLKARVLEALSSMDIAPDVASALAARTPSRTNLEDTSKLPLALLLRQLPVVDQLSTVNGGVFALVGPTGAGKTTTIAKLAARWSMRHGSDDLALVSTDSYRIGAREQLMTYARILGATMHAPNSGRELARVLERVKSKRLVLIDTAGMGPRDVRLSEQLEALKLGAGRAKVLLTLPATGEGHALEEIVRAFAPASPSACIITKVDEAASLGAVISTALRHEMKIAYLCNGQRVPEDLHAAHQRRVWLVRAAQKLMQHAPLKRDDAYFARNFGRAQAHA
jgi:flagellar biosynthesis protein FlhF